MSSVNCKTVQYPKIESLVVDFIAKPRDNYVYIYIVHFTFFVVKHFFPKLVWSVEKKGTKNKSYIGLIQTFGLYNLEKSVSYRHGSTNGQILCCCLLFSTPPLMFVERSPN